MLDGTRSYILINVAANLVQGKLLLWSHQWILTNFIAANTYTEITITLLKELQCNTNLAAKLRETALVLLGKVLHGYIQGYIIAWCLLCVLNRNFEGEASVLTDVVYDMNVYILKLQKVLFIQRSSVRSQRESNSYYSQLISTRKNRCVHTSALSSSISIST